MDKNVRNLLITGMVACLVGIIMGVGIVAPSVPNTDTQTEKSLVIQERMTEDARDGWREMRGNAFRCVDEKNELIDKLKVAVEQSDSFQKSFWSMADEVDSCQNNNKRAMELLDRCISEFGESHGLSE